MPRILLTFFRMLLGVASVVVGVAIYAAEAGPDAMPPNESAPSPSTGMPPGTPLPPWMSPEVIKATVEIGMDPDQQQKFRTAVGDYITNMNAMITKEMRRESVDKERTIKRKNNALVKKLDAEVKGFLREDQWPKYLAYKDVLKGKLGTMAGG